MAKIDIYSSDWCDEVFTGKNKSYGAYPLRRASDHRHTIALIWVVSVTTLFFLLPTLLFHLAQYATPKRHLVQTEVTSLSKLAKPEDILKELKKLGMDAPPPQMKSMEDEKATIKFSAPIIKDDDEITEREMAESQQAFAQAISPLDALKNDSTNKEKYTIPEQLVLPPKDDDKTVYMYVDNMPEFPGGQMAMMQYLSKNIQYPFWAIRYAEQGEVLVQFIVNVDGTFSECRILKSAGPYLDIEALRVIRTMPHWTPGKKNGKLVRSRCVLPIVFRLQ
jgi:protein TonB